MFSPASTYCTPPAAGGNRAAHGTVVWRSVMGRQPARAKTLLVFSKGLGENRPFRTMEACCRHVRQVILARWTWTSERVQIAA